MLCSTMHSLVLTMAVLGQAPADNAFPAHRVVGNVYYVGSKNISSFLITTPKGHFLINSGYEETVPLIRASVEKSRSDPILQSMRRVRATLGDRPIHRFKSVHQLLARRAALKVFFKCENLLGVELPVHVGTQPLSHLLAFGHSDSFPG